MTKNEVKACPWCGGEGAVFNNGLKGKYKKFYVKCLACYAISNTGTMTASIKWWNNRRQPPDERSKI